MVGDAGIPPVPRASIVRLGGAALVAVMQPAHLGNGNDAPQRRRMHGSSIRGVFAERQVCSRPMVIGEIPEEGSTERGFTENDHVIETLPTNGADDAFDVGSLPG